jgi:hypothetical protein
VVAVLGTIVGWRLVADLDRGIGQSLEATGNVIATVDESFVVAEDVLAILADGVEDAEGAVRALGRSMQEGEEALLAATRLTGEEVADAIEGIEEGLPAIESAAQAIDDALGALSGLPFGLAYDADRPLAASIRALREDLRDLPAELRDQADQVRRTADELTAATTATVATADALVRLDESIADATGLVGDYAAQTGDIQVLVETQRESLAVSARRAQRMVVAFGLVFLVGQFVPLYLGLQLIRGPLPAVREEPV